MTLTQSDLSPAESLSALVDGQVDPSVVLNNLRGETISDWNAYQAIGDVLRAPGTAASRALYGADPLFVQRLMRSLENENVKSTAVTLALSAVADGETAAANDSIFRWKVVTGFASFSALAAVAWALLGVSARAPEQLAARAVGTELLVASPQGVMVRDARLEELLSAHKQLGDTSLQAPSGFLRNAGFESISNGRR